MGELYPTKSRLALAQGIRRGEVRHWPFRNPWTQWQPTQLDERVVTARVAELRTAGLVEVSAQADVRGALLVRLTPAGEAWLADATGFGVPRPVRCRAGHLLGECTCQPVPGGGS